jgi:hypothetical protein
MAAVWLCILCSEILATSLDEFEGVGDSIHNDTDTVPIESTARKAVFLGSLKTVNIVDPMRDGK